MIKTLAPEGRSRVVLYIISSIIGGTLLMVAWWFNHPLFLLINGWHGKFADEVLGIISGLGDGLAASVLLTSLMLWRLRVGIAGISAFIVSGLLAQVLKYFFDTPRPPVVFEHVHLLGARLVSHSFPSGHAATDGTMAALCICLWGARDWKTWLGVIMFLFAAYGRIYGGVHFPLDVVVGLILGFGSMAICWRNIDEQIIAPWSQGEWGWRIPVMLLITEAAILGLGYRMRPTTAQVLAPVFSVSALVWVTQSWRLRRGNQSTL